MFLNDNDNKDVITRTGETCPNVIFPPTGTVGVPDWQDGADDTDEVLPTTNDAMGFTTTYVRPSETLADVARRCYGSNNVINRMRLLLANGGEIKPGYIKVPK